MKTTLQTPRILLVEGNRATRERYCRELRSAGYRVAATGSRRGALRRLSAGEPPDALVLDAAADQPGPGQILESALRVAPGMTVLLSTSQGGLWRDFASWAADGAVAKAQPPGTLARTLAQTMARRRATGAGQGGEEGKYGLTVSRAAE